MTEKETKVILGILKTAYPRFYANISREEAQMTVKTWSEMFEDIPIEIVTIAVKKLISQLKFPPSIADVREAIAESVDKPYKTPDEAWDEVQKSLRKYGYYNQQEGLEYLSPIVKQIVSAMGYKNLCLSEDHMVDRAHFMRMYEAKINAVKRDRVIPLPVKQDMQKIQENKAKLQQVTGKLLEKWG